MGCEPSIQQPTNESDNQTSNNDFVVNYSQLVSKDRGDICQFYHFSKIISRSPTSIVRKAVHRSNKRERVCKIIPIPQKDCMGAMREVETLRRMDHPNIVQIHEYFMEEAFLYIVLEEIPGRTLINQVVANGGIKLYDIVSVMRQLLCAVQFIHAKGYCHRAINPENILLVKSPQGFILKLIDFSQACVKDCPFPSAIPRTKRTSTFQPPEHHDPTITNKNLQKRDIWGCASVLYTLISGRSAKNLNLNKIKMISQIKQSDFFALGIDLLEKMTDDQPQKRPSAKECLQHQFFSINKKVQDTEKNTSILNNMLLFNASNKLRSLFCMYASLNLSSFQERSEFLVEFHNLDQNRDGHLDFEEMVEGIQNTFNVPRQMAEKHAQDIFTSLDKNNNGTLDYSEFLMGTMAVNRALSDQDLKHIFNEIDTNGDGNITEQELNGLIEGLFSFKSLGINKKQLSFVDFKKLMKELAQNQSSSSFF